MYSAESPLAVATKQTRGRSERASERTKRSSSGFSGSIEKPPPPSATMRRRSTPSIVSARARPGDAGANAHERRPAAAGEPGPGRDPRHQRAALRTGDRDPDGRLGMVDQGAAARRRRLVRGPAQPPPAPARRARRNAELLRRFGGQRRPEGA